eukprot:gb/GECG01002825.1/.p1 GENE.gb/GECG01002825.1/~~gb/GECG01002825.1/.p1  ORF type:complete len:492 (+),score=62.18 gb/GECG01002825.1/:1-1476(+)
MEHRSQTENASKRAFGLNSPSSSMHGGGGGSRTTRDVVDETKSANDKNEYRLLHLENGLRLLLISDMASITSDSTKMEVYRTPHTRVKSNEDSDGAGEASHRKRQRVQHEHEREESDGSSSSDGSDSDSDPGNEVRGSARYRRSSKKLKQNPTVEDRRHKEERKNAEQGEPDQPSQEYRRAALGIGVQAGSFHDPDEVEGLAHFLEHMIFMGSKKYPNENEFEQFLSDRGGFSNAYTELEHTVFYFEVLGKYFQEATERFSQFFISPLCKKEATDRELQAIEDEFAAATQDDYTRLEAVMAHTSDCDHVMHKFSWGNIQSLRDTPAKYGRDPHAALFTLFNSMYSADRMHVVARAPYTLDALEELIAPIFQKVPRRGGLAEYTPQQVVNAIEHSKLASPFLISDAYQQENVRRSVPCLHRLKPVRTRSILHVSWAIPTSLVPLQSARCARKKTRRIRSPFAGSRSTRFPPGRTKRKRMGNGSLRWNRGRRL